MQAPRASAATALTAVLSLLALALFGALSAAAMDTRQHASASPSSIAPIAAAKPPHPSPHHAIRSVRLVPSTQGTEPPSRTHRTEDCHNHYLPHHWCVVSALSDLFTATHGASWSNSTNWLSGDPCTNGWSGITCTNGLVTALYASARASRSRTTAPHRIAPCCKAIEQQQPRRDHSNDHRPADRLAGTVRARAGDATVLLFLPLPSSPSSPSSPSPSSPALRLQPALFECHLGLHSVDHLAAHQLGTTVRTHTTHSKHIVSPSTGTDARTSQSTIGSSLYDDYLSGTIPSAIGSLVNLQYLYGQCVQLSLLSFLRTDVVELHDGAQSHVQQQPGRLDALDHRAALAADLPVPHLPSPLCCGACTDTG